MPRTPRNRLAALSNLTTPQSVVNSCLTVDDQNTAPPPIPTTSTKRIFEVGENTVIVCTDRDVYVTNIDETLDQKYISNITASAINVGLVSGTTYSNCIPFATKLGFDVSSGFCLTNLGNGVAKISGGGGGGGTPGGLNTNVQFNNNGTFGGNNGFTYDGTTCEVGMEKIKPPVNTSLTINTTSDQQNWYSLYGDLGTDVNNDYGSQVACDSDENLYVVGASYNGLSGSPYLAKFDKNGALLWQKGFTDISSNFKEGNAVCVDVFDNVYCVIGTNAPAIFYTVFKFDSSGNLLWSKDVSSPDQQRGLAIFTDTSFNVIVSGTINIAGTNYVLLVKFDNSGNLLWQRLLASGGGTATGVAVDASDNSYIIYKGSLGTQLGLAKFDTSGNLQWQKLFTAPGTVNAGVITLDPTGLIYISGNYFTGSTGGLYIIKLDNAGNLTWQRNILGVEYTTPYGGISVDSANNIYVSAYQNVSGAGNYDIFVAKLNSLGVVQWQRTFGGLLADVIGWTSYKTLTICGSSYVVTGYTYNPSATTYETITFKMPTDGSLEGVYRQFTYSSASLATNTTPFTSSTSLYAVSLGTTSISAATVNPTTISNTATVVKIFGGSNTWRFNKDGTLDLPQYTLPLTAGVEGQVFCINDTGIVQWADARILLDANCSLIIGGNLPGNGTSNIILGKNSLWNNTSGSYNTGFSACTLYSNISGCNNFAAGRAALYSNTTGNNNIAIGQCALYNTTTSNNFAAGFDALKNNTTGANNIALGGSSLALNIAGSDNIAIGQNSGCAITGSGNTVLGQLPATGCTCTVLVGAGTCERIKVDTTGLYINCNQFNICGSNTTCIVKICGGNCERLRVQNDGLYINCVGPIGGTTTCLSNTYITSLYKKMGYINGTSGIIPMDVSQNGSFYLTNITGDWGVNLVNLNLPVGYLFFLELIVIQQVLDAWLPVLAFQIGGVTQTMRWVGGNLPPSSSSKGKVNVAHYWISRNSAGTTYTVSGDFLITGT